MIYDPYRVLILMLLSFNNDLLANTCCCKLSDDFLDLLFWEQWPSSGIVVSRFRLLKVLFVVLKNRISRL